MLWALKKEENKNVPDSRNKLGLIVDFDEIIARATNAPSA